MLVVLDYELIIDSRTAADVQLGRGREAVSSTTRNQSSSELQMGRNRNRDPPSTNRDEACQIVNLSACELVSFSAC